MKKQLLLGVAALSMIAVNAYAVEDNMTAPGASDTPAVASADQDSQKTTTHKHRHHHKGKKKKTSKAKEQESTAQEASEQGGEPAPVGALREGR
ncbi:MAG TPA: hypothetical protein VFT64_02205 [Rickettsiales bacterium]|nr:hypothetical protein [Rickettsiales bacterium]